MTYSPGVISDVRRVRHLFSSAHLGLVADAVVAGNSPATVWAEDVEAPRTALAWDGAYSVYLVGELDDPGRWRAAFDREIVPRCKGFLKLYITQSAAEAVFGGCSLQRRGRIFYRGAGGAVGDWRLPDGYRISALGDRFDALSALGNGAEVIAEIESCWRSVDDFRRTGFGFVAHDDKQVLCWCTAEYVSDGRCGIGVETIPAYQGLGFATATARAFTEHCVERNVTPYWDAWTDNLPSVRVAEKLGFREVETYSIYTCDLGR